jgi:hypothetical protein
MEKILGFVDVAVHWENLFLDFCLGIELTRQLPLPLQVA